LKAHLYLVALGSNQRIAHIGTPAAVIAQAIAALEMPEIDVFDVSPIIGSIAVGPSQRQYANAAALLSSDLEPPEMLLALQSIERHFGRNRSGQRWRARTLDLDIILWSGGIWSSMSPPLSIPHICFRDRNFVLTPALAIAADWREPLTGLSIRQLFHRHNRAKPLDPARNRL
jgi:2-amino-4-hydroxy-6-hydroxymethyldihydropteridine diphosphokinase